MHDDSVQDKPVEWKPISSVEQLAPLKHRNKLMNHTISEIVSENKEYFRGKELRIDNLAHFYQCIIDPRDDQGFIAVQNRNKTLVKEKDHSDDDEESSINTDDDAEMDPRSRPSGEVSRYSEHNEGETDA